MDLIKINDIKINGNRKRPRVITKIIVILLSVFTVSLIVYTGCNNHTIANDDDGQKQTMGLNLDKQSPGDSTAQSGELKKLNAKLIDCYETRSECEAIFNTFSELLIKDKNNIYNYSDTYYKICDMYMYKACAMSGAKDVIDHFLKQKIDKDRLESKNNFCLLVTFRVNEHYQDAPEECYSYNELCKRIDGDETTCEEFRYELESDKWYCLITEEE